MTSNTLLIQLLNCQSQRFSLPVILIVEIYLTDGFIILSKTGVSTNNKRSIFKFFNRINKQQSMTVYYTARSSNDSVYPFLYYSHPK